MNAEHIKLIQKQFNINQRNQLLAETDKYMLPDFPISADDLLIVKQYRQALRDFTNNDYIMPDKPAFIPKKIASSPLCMSLTLNNIL